MLKGPPVRKHEESIYSTEKTARNAQNPMSSKKRQIFIDEYLKSFNATQSAIKAGYSARTAYSIGQELLKFPEVAAEIKRRLDESHMSADEALKLLAEHARGDIGEITDEFGNIDWKLAREKNLTHLIKKVKQKTTIIQGRGESGEDKEITDIEVELHDPQAAIDKILKVQGVYKNSLDITSKGEKINEIVIRYADSDNSTKAPSGATPSEAGETPV